MEMYLSHMLVYRVLEKTKLTTLLDNALIFYVSTVALTILITIVFSFIAKNTVEYARFYLQAKRGITDVK